jgi:hypothetical protein
LINKNLQDDLECVHTIVLCSLHQKRIADDVLNMSKLTSGLLSLSLEEFDALQEITNVIRMFRPEVFARGLTLTLEKDESWNGMGVKRVIGDSGRFIQVMVNLIRWAVVFVDHLFLSIFDVEAVAMQSSSRRRLRDETCVSSLVPPPITTTSAEALRNQRRLSILMIPCSCVGRCPRIPIVNVSAYTLQSVTPVMA